MLFLTDSQRDIQARAKALSDGYVKDKAAEIDRTEQYPWETTKKLAEAGFMGMSIPKELGGQGASYLDVVLVIEQMARNCGVTARIVVEANMGGIGAIMAYGTQEQKELCAPYVLAGDKPAICITEPDAGSAATEMTTTAEKVDGGYKINGVKHWITGGGVSKVHLIFARVVENGEFRGIGGFIAIRDEDEGLRVGKREPAMGLRAIPETHLHFEDLFVADNRAVKFPQGYRKGFAALMNAYNAQRVGAATVAHGIAQGAFERAVEFSKEREQFGRPIAEFQGLQWMMSDMSTGLAAAQALIYKAAMAEEGQFPNMQEAAQAKIFAAENAIKVTDSAMQIHGAMGYSRNLPMERMYRDARMFTIGGGTAQMLRNQVASSLLEMKLPQTRAGHLKLAAE